MNTAKLLKVGGEISDRFHLSLYHWFVSIDIFIVLRLHIFCLLCSCTPKQTKISQIAFFSVLRLSSTGTYIKKHNYHQLNVYILWSKFSVQKSKCHLTKWNMWWPETAQLCRWLLVFCPSPPLLSESHSPRNSGKSLWWTPDNPFLQEFCMCSCKMNVPIFTTDAV